MLKLQRQGRSIDLNTLEDSNEVFSDTSIIYGDGSDKEINNEIYDDPSNNQSALDLSAIETNNDIGRMQERSPRSQILHQGTKPKFPNQEPY